MPIVYCIQLTMDGFVEWIEEADEEKTTKIRENNKRTLAYKHAHNRTSTIITSI